MNDRYNVRGIGGRGNGGRGNGARGDREGVTRRRFMETASSIGLGVALLAVPGVARAPSGPLKIGVMGSFTGPAGRTGEATQKGAPLAVADARPNGLLPLTIAGDARAINILSIARQSPPETAETPVPA